MIKTCSGMERKACKQKMKEVFVKKNYKSLYLKFEIF